MKNEQKMIIIIFSFSFYEVKCGVKILCSKSIVNSLTNLTYSFYFSLSIAVGKFACINIQRASFLTIFLLLCTFKNIYLNTHVYNHLHRISSHSYTVCIIIFLLFLCQIMHRLIFSASFSIVFNMLPYIMPYKQFIHAFAYKYIILFIFIVIVCFGSFKGR